MKPLSAYWERHGKVALLTFEIFWILIFLLHAATSGEGAQIVQFQYVNF